jgi:hypothetical protein
MIRIDRLTERQNQGNLATQSHGSKVNYFDQDRHRNPVDHPNGGGAGKSKSGGGWQQLTSPWGLLAKGYRTRHKKKQSNRFILVRRDGRPMKRK